MCGTRKKKHEAVLQFRHHRRTWINRLNLRTAIGQELDEVQPAERRRVFVLLSDVVMEHIARNVEGTFSKFVLRERHVNVTRKSLEDIDADAGGRTQAGSRRNF